MARWMKYENNLVVEGPGPLPIYINAPNGDPLKAADATEAEIAAAGWMRVTEGRRAYDRRFEIENGPVFEVAEGQPPIDRYSYQYRENARYYMQMAIDMMAEIERRSVITALPGQIAEYTKACSEAEAAQDDAASGITPLIGQYPYLEADVGVTVNPLTGEKVVDVFEAAEVVLAARQLSEAAGAVIRARRLAAKQAVREAESDAAAHAVVEQFFPAVTQLFVLNPNSTHPYDEALDVWNPNLIPVVYE